MSIMLGTKICNKENFKKYVVSEEIKPDTYIIRSIIDDTRISTISEDELVEKYYIIKPDYIVAFHKVDNDVVISISDVCDIIESQNIVIISYMQFLNTNHAYRTNNSDPYIEFTQTDSFDVSGIPIIFSNIEEIKIIPFSCYMNNPNSKELLDFNILNLLRHNHAHEYPYTPFKENLAFETVRDIFTVLPYSIFQLVEYVTHIYRNDIFSPILHITEYTDFIKIMKREIEIKEEEKELFYLELFKSLQYIKETNIYPQIPIVPMFYDIDINSIHIEDYPKKVILTDQLLEKANLDKKILAQLYFSKEDTYVTISYKLKERKMPYECKHPSYLSKDELDTFFKIKKYDVKY